MNRLFNYSNNHMLLYQHDIGKHANEKIQILLQITYFSELKVEKILHLRSVPVIQM